MVIFTCICDIIMLSSLVCESNIILIFDIKENE